MNGGFYFFFCLPSVFFSGQAGGLCGQDAAPLWGVDGQDGAAALPDHGLVAPRCWEGGLGEQEGSGLSHQLGLRSRPSWVCPMAGRAQLKGIFLPKYAPMASGNVIPLLRARVTPPLHSSFW